MRAALLGADVLVPDPTDRLMNAIAHGVLDAHRHSDWLVDCAQLAGDRALDWPLIVTLARDLGIPAQVMLALSYLREVLGQPVPEDTLEQLWETTRSGLGDYYKTLLLGHPRHAHSLLGRAGRRLFKARHGAQVRAATGKADPGAAPRIKMRRIGRSAPFPEGAPALRHRLAVACGAERCSLVVGLEGGGLSRRYVFEVNTGDRHLARSGTRTGSGADPCALVRRSHSLPMSPATTSGSRRGSPACCRRSILPRRRPSSAPGRSGCWSQLAVSAIGASHSCTRSKFVSASRACGNRASQGVSSLSLFASTLAPD